MIRAFCPPAYTKGRGACNLMHTNRLAREKSPYLLQHAHNPVDWHAWGDEAFEAARREDKPIFLSVGYSTCHWCHVMAEESFEDPATAEILNRHFVAVKVDREERPDVDRVYMTFVQAATGSGGWPMSVWLTPELKPFYGGTYFPPEERHGRPAFRDLLEWIAQAWRTDRARILASSEALLDQIRQALRTRPAPFDAGLLESAFFAFRRGFDPVHGGFGGAPKFPRPAVHNFLLRYWERTGNQEALAMVLTTLQAMARGGVHDHLGGGFHRYAVDERWRVPHFEKMLYDQAQLAVSYLEAFQATGEDFYAAVARRTLDYVLRDLTHPEGGFFSAEDADSAPDPAHPEIHREGAFYLWTRSEIEQLLGPAAEWFCRRYGVEPGGNVADDPQGEFTGRNILFEAHSLEETAVQSAAVAKLREARETRPRPHRDDKILTAWNALMISALARAALPLKEPRYLTAARRATDFLCSRCLEERDGALTLWRRYRDEEAAIPGFLEDYAFFVQALLDLHEADPGPRDLDLAVCLTARQRELFEDREEGGFFSAPAEDAGLVLRLKDDHDGAEPAGNSIAVLNLLRLAQKTGREEFRESADRAFQAFSGRCAAAPEVLPQMLVARLRWEEASDTG